MTQLKSISLTLVLALALASAAVAQDHSRNWKNGNVVVITQVTTKPGMYNAYINDLNNVWRKFMEEQKKDGQVLDYGMFANGFSRAGEPDLILTVTYPNWAAFDRGPDYFEEVSKRIAGGPEAMRAKAVDREALRTIGSTMVFQQVKFNDQE